MYPVKCMLGGAWQIFLNTCREMKESSSKFIVCSHKCQSSRGWASLTVHGSCELVFMVCDMRNAKLSSILMLWRVNILLVLASQLA